jgi:hypothetical protein
MGFWLGVLGCAGEPLEGSEGSTDEVQAPEETLQGLELLRGISGLWNGSATQTPLGAFPWMPVDLRPVNEHTVWGRVDIDPENALRFAFELEDHDGLKLVYRNGGYFLGLQRDDKTVLTEADPEAGVYRFCHLEQGCDYIDATYTLAGDELELFVLVRGQPHLDWSARRLEPREVPDDFPSPEGLPGDAALPELPEAEISVSWSTPLSEEAHLWVLLATRPCMSLQCVPSRASLAVVPAGQTQGVVRMPEIHPGEYLATAVLDYDRDLMSGVALAPELTDGYSLPDRPLTVAEEGLTSTQLVIALQ